MSAIVVQPIRYWEAVRLVLFGERPRWCLPDGDMVLFAYLPGGGAESIATIRANMLAGSGTALQLPIGPDKLAADTLLRAAAPDVLVSHPPERALVAGVQWREVPGGVFNPTRPLDPSVGPQGTEEQLAITEGRVDGPAAAAELVRSWAALSDRRAAHLRAIWAADMREDGPHQPWTRERARFLSSLLYGGILPPAIALLPQWHLQWWYDAAGYEQDRPSDLPRPARCWKFPSPEGAPSVCGHALPCPTHHTRVSR